MQYWLLKTEPETFSWDDLVKEGESMWDGVRNYQARNNLRSMKKGDHFLFYHSVKNQAIVGIAEVAEEHFPDPTAKEGDWSAIRVKPVQKLKRIITLQEVKENKQLQEMVLLKNSRLSVQPVAEKDFKLIVKLSG